MLTRKGDSVGTIVTDQHGHELRLARVSGCERRPDSGGATRRSIPVTLDHYGDLEVALEVDEKETSAIIDTP